MPLICFFLLIRQLGDSTWKQGKWRKETQICTFEHCDPTASGFHSKLILNTTLKFKRSFKIKPLPYRGMFPYIIPSCLLMALLIYLTFSHFLQVLLLIKRLEKVPKFKRMKWLSQQNWFCGLPSLLRTLQHVIVVKLYSTFKKKKKRQVWVLMLWRWWSVKMCRGCTAGKHMIKCPDRGKGDVSALESGAADVW